MKARKSHTRTRKRRNKSHCKRTEVRHQPIQIETSDPLSQFLDGRDEQSVETSFDEHALHSCAHRLEKARAQWQVGDWIALAHLAETDIERCSERARLALLAAAGLAQLGQMESARKQVEASLKWGCDRQLVARVLLGGALNSLATAALRQNDNDTAKSYFTSAVQAVTPYADTELLARSRMLYQMARHGQLSDAAALLEEEISEIDDLSSPNHIAILKGGLHAIKSELEVVRSRSNRGNNRDHLRLPRAAVDAPFVIVVAGVPRSGSTWLFNSVRYLCEAAGESYYAEWCEDYDPESQPPRSIDIVKLHNPEALKMPVHRILTTNRDLIERLASLVRMRWLDQDPRAIHKAAKAQAQLLEYWSERSDCEIQYNSIKNQPIETIEKISRAIDMICDNSTAKSIAKKLNNLASDESMSINRHGHNSETLMHVNHRATDRLRKYYINLVYSALEKAQT